GVEMRLIIDGGATPAARVDLPLLTATARAYRWSNDLLEGRARSIGEIARREHLTGRHVRRMMRLAFLALGILPKCVPGSRKILAGSQMDLPKSRTENFVGFSRSAAADGILRVHR